MRSQAKNILSTKGPLFCRALVCHFTDVSMLIDKSLEAYRGYGWGKRWRRQVYGTWNEVKSFSLFGISSPDVSAAGPFFNACFCEMKSGATEEEEEFAEAGIFWTASRAAWRIPSFAFLGAQRACAASSYVLSESAKQRRRNVAWKTIDQVCPLNQNAVMIRTFFRTKRGMTSSNNHHVNDNTQRGYGDEMFYTEIR